MPLPSRLKQQFKAQAHALKPIVLIGNHGLTQPVLDEIDRGLYDHELIKIRIFSEDREQRLTWLDEICQTLQAELIQKIGKIAVLYRKRPATKK